MLNVSLLSVVMPNVGMLNVIASYPLFSFIPKALLPLQKKESYENL
jgi:hypothetical protein